MRRSSVQPAAFHTSSHLWNQHNWMLYWCQHLLCCWRVCPPPPTIPTAVGRRADIRKFWWTLSFHLLSENRLWVVADAEMLQFCAVASNFSQLRDDVVRQKCQRSCLHFCRCWTCRRQVDLGIFSIGVVYCGTFCVLPQRDAVRIPHEGAEMCGRSTVSKFSPLLLCLSIQREYMRPHWSLHAGSQFRQHNYAKI